MEIVSGVKDRVKLRFLGLRVCGVYVIVLDLKILSHVIFFDGLLSINLYLKKKQ